MIYMRTGMARGKTGANLYPLGFSAMGLKRKTHRPLISLKAKGLTVIR
jgi:hypothetical protein